MFIYAEMYALSLILVTVIGGKDFDIVARTIRMQKKPGSARRFAGGITPLCHRNQRLT